MTYRKDTRKYFSNVEKTEKENQIFIKENGLVEHPKFTGYYGTKDARVFSNKGKYGKLRELKPHEQKENNGYYYVSCSGHQMPYHRFIAQIFLLNENNYKEVNHIDGDKSNNRVENLEWCTRKQNVRHYHSEAKKWKRKYFDLLNRVDGRL